MDRRGGDRPTLIRALFGDASKLERREEFAAEVGLAADSYLIFAEDVVVGQIDVTRHPLTEHLIQYGGHVGYHVHPGDRNRGIASWALHTALSSAAKGLTEAPLTCAHRQRRIDPR